MFPRIWQQLTDKTEKDHQQAIIRIQRQHQLAIIEHDSQIQAIQYEKVGLQGEIRNARQTVIELIENRHIPRIGKYDDVLCVFQKNQEDETGQAGEHPYCMVLCQKRVFPLYKRCLKIRYPNIPEKVVCDHENAIHAWNRFRTSLVMKTGIEITSVYQRSSMNSLKICLILIHE